MTRKILGLLLIGQLMASMVLSENTTNEMPIEQVNDIQEKDGSVSEAQDLPEDSNIKVEKQALGPMDGHWEPDWLYVFISTPLLIMIVWSYTVGCRKGFTKNKNFVEYLYIIFCKRANFFN